jgi:hypothetical protein
MISFQENAAIFDIDPPLALLRNAILSLSVTFFGSQHRQDRITAKGYHQYGGVLRQLNVALGDPARQTINATILTALTCMLLEIFLPTGPANFLKHQRGIEALMALRGPPTETEGDTAIIFRGLRIVSIIGALAESRPSIYAKKEWKHAPVASTTEMGVLHHKIFAVLADCTQLTSECNSLSKSEPIQESYGSLLVRADRALDDLSALYPIWESINASEMRDTEQMSPLAIELGVANHLSASAYMLYHTARICIIQIKDRLCPSPSNVKLRNAAAMNIAKCLELKEYEKRQGGPESNTIGFVATKVAWQALGGFNTPEGRKLAQVVRSAVNGVYRSPWEQVETDNASLLDSPDWLFAQLSPDASETKGMDHLIPREPEIIDVGFKHVSPSPEQVTFDFKNFMLHTPKAQ